MAARASHLHEESTLTRMMYFYFDPAALQMPSNAVSLK
jgi:hypothetical protein